MASDSSYDFNYQETRVLAEELVVKAGDNLRMVCDYKSVSRSGITEVRALAVAYVESLRTSLLKPKYELLEFEERRTFFRHKT